MMHARNEPVRPSTGDSDDIPLVLLGLTQDYLECQQSRRLPSSASVGAWESFYRQYLPMTRDWVRQLGVKEPEASDCVQEVWKDLILRLRSFQHNPGRCSFRTWLRVIVRNKAIDSIRRRNRLVFLPLDEAASAQLVDRPPAPLAEGAEAIDELRLAFQELSSHVSPRTFQVVWMRWIEKRSVNDTAAALGLTPQQVWARYHRGMKRLFGLVKSRYRQEGQGLPN